MRTRMLPLAAVVVVGALSLTSCMEDPCRKLVPPTDAEFKAAAAGAEVEREMPNGTECELVNGRWQRET